jgi:hypothetical protein
MEKVSICRMGRGKTREEMSLFNIGETHVLENVAIVLGQMK